MRPVPKSPFQMAKFQRPRVTCIQQWQQTYDWISIAPSVSNLTLFIRFKVGLLWLWRRPFFCLVCEKISGIWGQWKASVPIIICKSEGLFRSKLADQKTTLRLQNCRRFPAQVDGKINHFFVCDHLKIGDLWCLRARPEQTLRSTFIVWWHHYDHRTMISILCEYLCQMVTKDHP